MVHRIFILCLGDATTEFAQHAAYSFKFAIVERIEWFSEVFDKGGLYAWMVYVSVFSNVLGAAFLTGFGGYCLVQVLRNQTMLDTDGSSPYDVGPSQNWRQVFGQRRWLWPLPVNSSGQSRGYDYPRKSEKHIE